MEHNRNATEDSGLRRCADEPTYSFLNEGLALRRKMQIEQVGHSLLAARTLASQPPCLVHGVVVYWSYSNGYDYDVGCIIHKENLPDTKIQMNTLWYRVKSTVQWQIFNNQCNTGLYYNDYLSHSQYSLQDTILYCILQDILLALDTRRERTEDISIPELDKFS